jgi:hypothetical protein
MTMGSGDFSGVVLHGGAVFAQKYSDTECIVFTSVSSAMFRDAASLTGTRGRGERSH